MVIPYDKLYPYGDEGDPADVHERKIAERLNGQAQPAPEGNAPKAFSKSKPKPLRVSYASALKLRPVQWLSRGWIPFAALTLFAGQGGMGKSAITAAWVARATRGQLNGRYRGQPVKVLWVGNEDGFEDVIGVRLKMAGADMDKVAFLQVDSENLADELNIVTDIDRLKEVVEAEDIKLVVVDPVVEYLPTSTESHNDKSVRQALRPARALAAALNISVLGIIHFNKSGSTDVASRIAASAGFRNAARSMLIVADHPEDKTLRGLFQNKSNWGPDVREGRVYRIEGVHALDHNDKLMYEDDGRPATTARVVWEGTIELDPNVLPGGDGEREAPKHDRATEMLRELLGEQPWLRFELEQQAKLEDVGWRTVRRAADELEVEKRQFPVPGQKGPGPSWWALPGTDWDEFQWLVTSSPSPDGQSLAQPKSAGQGPDGPSSNEWLSISERDGNVANHQERTDK
jgi:hypothetical protein